MPAPAPAPHAGALAPFDATATTTTFTVTEPTEPTDTSHALSAAGLPSSAAAADPTTLPITGSPVPTAADGGDTDVTVAGSATGIPTHILSGAEILTGSSITTPATASATAVPVPDLASGTPTEEAYTVALTRESLSHAAYEHASTSAATAGAAGVVARAMEERAKTVEAAAKELAAEAHNAAKEAHKTAVTAEALKKATDKQAATLATLTGTHVVTVLASCTCLFVAHLLDMTCMNDTWCSLLVMGDFTGCMLLQMQACMDVRHTTQKVIFKATVPMRHALLSLPLSSYVQAISLPRSADNILYMHNPTLRTASRLLVGFVVCRG